MREHAALPTTEYERWKSGIAGILLWRNPCTPKGVHVRKLQATSRSRNATRKRS
jgi:hypothetical protein